MKGLWVLFYFQLFQNGNGAGDFNPALGKSCLFLTPFTRCSGPFVLDIQGHSSETQPWGLLPFSESGPGKLLTPFKPRNAGQFLPHLSSNQEAGAEEPGWSGKMENGFFFSIKPDTFTLQIE